MIYCMKQLLSVGDDEKKWTPSSINANRFRTSIFCIKLVTALTLQAASTFR